MDLIAALQRLPRAQREAIALHHLAGLPVHEVAATLDVPTGTVKARLVRGRAALATQLGENDTRAETRHG
jgi:RNA polymerase sigma-70 factor (ECF subfamily)